VPLPATFAIGGDLPVCRVGYGALALTGLGGWGEPRRRDAVPELLRYALELGVQLFDTADSYGPSVSEELLAEALYPYPPDLVIATKGGSIREGPSQLRPDGRPEHLRAACEGSLRRLRLERIDLYQLHIVDPTVPLAESVGALADLRAAGKIRHVGLCNVPVEDIEAARRVVPIVSVQNHYNVALPGIEDDVIDYCAREGLAYLPWEPLAKGSLARPHGALATVAAHYQVTPAQVALAWLLKRSNVIVAIPGTLSPAHLEQNVRAVSLELTDDDLAELASYRLSRLDARNLARRFVPPRFRRLAVAGLRAVRPLRMH
jgi:pyridoxine 4-dehydrogenase